MTAAYLLDSSVAFALVAMDHEHHDMVSRWAGQAGRMALCPISEGFIIRSTVRLGSPAELAKAAIKSMYQTDRFEFWPDAASYTQTDLGQVRGHRQVTDAYLVGLAVRNQAKLATLDHALAQLYPANVALVA
jgi:predicted nucleic acid-binding protein